MYKKLVKWMFKDSPINVRTEIEKQNEILLEISKSFKEQIIIQQNIEKLLLEALNEKY